MPWKYTDEYYKDYTRQTWDECAEKYVPLQQQLVPYHKAIIEQLKPQSGQRILDVCTGPGEPAMSIAALIGPGGHVVGVDLSSNMTEMARKNAKSRGLSNVEFLTMDAEKLDLPPESFDLAVSCFGLQIVTDPDAAAKEILRILKPGATAGFTVWSTGDKAPALHVLVGPMLEHAEPDETGYLPTPYELGGPGELVAMLDRIGFSGAKETRMVDNWSASSVDNYLAIFLEGSPLGHSLSEEDPEIQEMILDKMRKSIAEYRTDDGVVIPAECVLVTAAKPNTA